MTREPGDLPLFSHPIFNAGSVIVRNTVEVTPINPIRIGETFCGNSVVCMRTPASFLHLIGLFYVWGLLAPEL